MFREVKIKDRLPELNKWVTTIDSAGEHRVYRLVEILSTNGVIKAWNMRDSNGTNSPTDNLELVYWLEKSKEDINDSVTRGKKSGSSTRLIDHLIEEFFEGKTVIFPSSKEDAVGKSNFLAVIGSKVYDHIDKLDNREISSKIIETRTHKQKFLDRLIYDHDDQSLEEELEMKYKMFKNKNLVEFKLEL